MIDDGAPIVSLAAAEYTNAAIYWQEQARTAAEKAMYYSNLATSLDMVYRHLIDKNIKEYVNTKL